MDVHKDLKQLKRNKTIHQSMNNIKSTKIDEKIMNKW